MESRGIHVVLLNEQRPLTGLMSQTAPSGTMLLWLAAYLESLDVVDVLAQLSFGLDDHLPGSTKTVEIVDVELAAEVHLQGVEHVAESNAHPGIDRG